MSCMFYGCSSLNELNISNFNTNNVADMSGMFDGCSDELKLKIRREYKILKKLLFIIIILIMIIRMVLSK